MAEGTAYRTSLENCGPRGPLAEDERRRGPWPTELKECPEAADGHPEATDGVSELALEEYPDLTDEVLELFGIFFWTSSVGESSVRQIGNFAPVRVFRDKRET